MPQTAVELADNREHQRRIQHRSRQAELLDLAIHLPDDQRLMIEQIYHHGLTVTDVAQLIGAHPRALQRRVDRLIGRMRHPTFRLAAEHAHIIPTDLSSTARQVVLLGQSMRTTANHSNRTLHRVRMDMQALYTLTETFVGPVHRSV